MDALRALGYTPSVKTVQTRLADGTLTNNYSNEVRVAELPYGMQTITAGNYRQLGNLAAAASAFTSGAKAQGAVAAARQTPTGQGVDLNAPAPPAYYGAPSTPGRGSVLVGNGQQPPGAALGGDPTGFTPVLTVNGRKVQLSGNAFVGRSKWASRLANGSRNKLPARIGRR